MLLSQRISHTYTTKNEASALTSHTVNHSQVQ